MSLTEAMEAVRQITDRGNSAEVKRQTDGSYTVYEVKKNKVTCTE